MRQFVCSLCFFVLVATCTPRLHAQQVVDNTGALSTAPFRVSPLEPGVCSFGQFYVNSSTGLLRQCISPSVWASLTGGSVGLSTLNGDATAAQVIALGSGGTDFAIAESGATHTINLPTADGSHTGKLAAADWTNFNGKQPALGFTAENVANKDTTVTLGGSNTLYPSQLAVKTYVDTGLSAKQASLGFTAENVANKATSTSLGTSNTLYPTQNAVKAYVDAAIAGVGGTGTVAVVASGVLVNGACVTGGGTTLVQTPSPTCTIDSAGNLSTPGSATFGVGSGVAGYAASKAGTAPTPPANTFGWIAPGTMTTAVALQSPNAVPVAHQMMVFGATASNIAPYVYKTWPDCQDTVGQHLNFTQSSDTPTCGTSGPSTAAQGPYVPQSGTGASQTAVMPTTGWTIVNGLKVTDFFTSYISLSIPSNGSLNWRFYTRTNATSNYTTYAVIQVHAANPTADSQTCGVYVSDGTKYEGFELLSAASGPTQLRIEKITNTTTDSATVFGATANLTTRQLAVKIVDDSVHRTWFYWAGATGGGGWVQALQETSGTFLTETKAGVGGYTLIGTTYAGDCDVLYWSQQ